MPDPVTPHISRSSQRRLSEPEKREIVAAIASGDSQVAVAQRFNVHINTINRLIVSVRRGVKDSVLSASTWRSRLTDTLPTHSVDAIERSVKDLADPHKAASTAIAHLKGIGALQSESNQQVNVFFSQINNLPDDVKAGYITADSSPVNSTQVVDTTVDSSDQTNR